MMGDGGAEAGYEENPEDKERRVQEYGRLCDTLKNLRDEAVKGRAESGIEEIWQEDEDFYLGIDGASKPELRKSTSTEGGLRSVTPGSNTTPQSRVFVEITRPYVDAASARVADMLLPTDDRNWMLAPTPIPDMVTAASKAPAQALTPADVVGQPPAPTQGQPVQMPGQPPAMVAPPTPEQQAADKARAVIEAAKTSAEKAQTQIDDWLTQSLFLDECRSVIDDAARIGVGIIKGPIPKRMRKKAVVKELQRVGIVIAESIEPISVRVNPFNFYPDPTCGEDIQKGKYCFEFDEMNGRQLADLKGTPGYLDDVIDEILEEGPDGHKDTTRRTEKRSQSDAEKYGVWYFHGYLSAEDLDLMGTAHGAGKQFPVIGTMVNDKIIKAALSPLDSGEFPYDVFIWQRRAGHWAGKGVARQMRTEQLGVNAATRAMMDNMGQASRPHKMMKGGVVSQGADPWTWIIDPDADAGDVANAMRFFNYPSQQVELMNVIQFWMQRAEDATGLPMLLQGQLGRSPDTVGGMQMLNNNASTVLRRIAKNYDARITERHIGRYYEWLLIHGKDDSAKGDFQIKARGSSALVERDMQAQVLLQSVNLALNPRFGLDPKKIMAKFLKSQRLDVKDLELSDEDAQKMSQPPQDPRIAVAQIREEGAGKRLQMELVARKEMEAMEFQFREWEKKIDATLAAAEMDGDKEINREQIKRALFDTTAKLRTQMELSMAAMRQADDHNRQAVTPPTEPVGRAENGAAFIQ